MIYGFIIAAGNQTRFNSNEPKALSKINDVSCLDINIHNLGYVCDSVFVVCSNENESYFKDYDRIVIDSGFGCGDAVLKALESIDFKDNDTCFIQWSDSISDCKIYKKLKNIYRHKCNLYPIIVPCNFENKPYVKLEQNAYNISVKFSKYGEVDSDGFHDLSIFYGSMKDIEFFCNVFKNKFFEDCKYNHKHGNEFNFLDIFNDTDISGLIFNANCKSYSFNTVDEYKSVLDNIGDYEWI